MRHHEKNGDVLKHKQNLEYDKSVEEEIIKSSKKDAMEKQILREKENEKNLMLFSEARKSSLEEAQRGRYKGFSEKFLNVLKLIKHPNIIILT